ncbi:MAG: hypothetical protein M0Q88_00300 [Bacilli bacterium]|nr:hypothetical protein [Bacilli bacterium]
MTSKIDQLIEDIFNLKTKVKSNEIILDSMKENVSKDKEQIENLSKELLLELNNINETQYEILDKKLVAQKFSRESVGYSDEAAVIAYLKEKYQANYIKTKITESLDKNALKKALKKDENLAKHLEDMTVKNTTEYVVVTDFENHQKMLEHINDKSTK